jgi:hypothetical protein
MRVGPPPEIVLDGNGIEGSVTGYGEIQYYFRLDKLVDDAPDGSVQIDFGGKWSVYTENAWMKGQIADLGPGDLNPIQLWSYNTAYGSPSIGNGTYAFSRYLIPGGESQITMRLDGEAGPSYPSGFNGTSAFQGVIDPTISIDPNSMVFYHGQDVPATDLYSLTFSPELGSSVPEPASLMLVGLGLIAIARVGPGQVRTLRLR